MQQKSFDHSVSRPPSLPAPDLAIHTASKRWQSAAGHRISHPITPNSSTPCAQTKS